MNKKIVIATFFVSILTLASFNCMADPTGEALPQIPSQQKTELDNYLDDVKDEVSYQEYQEILRIVDRVVEEYSNEGIKGITVDLYELGSVIEEYNYEGFDESEPNPIDQLIAFLLQIIQERLGWVYDLYDKAITIIQESKTILALASQTITAAKSLYQNVKAIVNLTTYLLKGDFSTFFKGWSPSFYISKIQTIIANLNTIIKNVPTLIDLIQQTITDATEFMDWLGSEPWTAPVVVYGEVKSIKGLTTNPIEDVKVSCEGEELYTDENGSYSFDVEITDTSDSIPPNSYYGLHKIDISAEKDGEEKAAMVPYVFSGGKLYSLFLFKNDDSEAKQKTRFFRPFEFLQGLTELRMIKILRNILNNKIGI